MHFIVPLVIFPFDIMFFIQGNQKQFDTLMDKYGIKDHRVEIPIKSKGRTIMFPSNHTLIILPQVPETTFHLAALQHEIFHATQFILEKMGIPLNEQTDEVYAYTIQYITNQVYRKFNIKP